MRKRITRLGAVLVLAAMAPAAMAQDGDIEKRGAETLAPFKKALMSALVSGLADGPVNAIGVCRMQAPLLAASAGGAGVRIGRTSHRLRNPANRPPAWTRPLLDAWAGDPAAAGPRGVQLANGGSGYVEPIFVQPMCLACHGETLQPAVAARLRELYPDDQATGYQADDFRGVFWVEFDPR